MYAINLVDQCALNYIEAQNKQTINTNLEFSTLILYKLELYSHNKI